MSKKSGRCPTSKIWEWFIKGDQVPNFKRYYAATCFFCKYNWIIAKVAKLKKHFAYECNKVDSNTKISILMMLTNQCKDLDDNTTSTLISNQSKKQKINDKSQTHIDDYYENFLLH